MPCAPEQAEQPATPWSPCRKHGEPGLAGTHSALDGREEGALVMLDLRARLAVRDDPC